MNKSQLTVILSTKIIHHLNAFCIHISLKRVQNTKAFIQTMETKSKSEGKRAAKGKRKKQCIISHFLIFYVEWLKSFGG